MIQQNLHPFFPALTFSLVCWKSVQLTFSSNISRTLKNHRLKHNTWAADVLFWGNNENKIFVELKSRYVTVYWLFSSIFYEGKKNIYHSIVFYKFPYSYCLLRATDIHFKKKWLQVWHCFQNCLTKAYQQFLIFEFFPLPLNFWFQYIHGFNFPHLLTTLIICPYYTTTILNHNTLTSTQQKSRISKNIMNVNKHRIS